MDLMMTQLYDEHSGVNADGCCAVAVFLAG